MARCGIRRAGLPRPAQQAATDRLGEIATALHRRLIGVDDGGATLSAISARVKAAIEAQAVALERLIGTVAHGALARLTSAEADLALENSTVLASDVGAVLQRGYALVLDHAGRLIRSERTARAARRLTLLFHDGTVAAVADSSSATKE